MKTRTSLAAAAFALGMCIGVPAAVAYPLETTTTVDDGGNGDTGEEQGAAAAAETEAAAQASGTLPVTGGDVIGLTLIGAGALAAGTVLVRRTRKG